ncbi:aquaporin Z [Siccirubricoccus deserti]|uniref:Aquaporin Z n=1 Tax=Siccirubricoccus deserti TaxID=2013562 RepID=A0A9X0R451_9PROT|nr:aquaporin Z [Siccirubricoccus deserti]MBC4018488.1 aquaporin Z [Siccirubricoccus deserti]GGC66229.1 aquaporin Z [Siccirubricoccus deserti]
MSRKLAAEFLGTFWLVFGGCGAVVLAAAFPQIGIGLLGVSLTFGLTVLTMAYAIGHISGCHLNPAVSLGLVAACRFCAVEAPGYIAAQLIGAIAAAFLLYLVASGQPGWDLAAKGLAANGFGDASPGRYPLVAGLVIEVTMTFFFALVILGATAARAPAGFAGLAIGLCLTLIHLISIPITNTSFNPARSTGPALAVGGLALQQLWVFWVAPIAGALAAGLLHRWLSAEEASDMADTSAAPRRAAASPDEALAPMLAREPR